jgi:hypothetical protein
MNDDATPPNGRTHEPSLRELTAEIDGLRELLNERNKWYGERDKDRQLAVDKALAAAEKATAAAFAASKEAIVKAEDGQKAYNVSHNDLLKRLDQQHGETLPRTEANLRFDTLTAAIRALELFKSNIEGRMIVWAGILVVASVGITQLLRIAFKI